MDNEQVKVIQKQSEAMKDEAALYDAANAALDKAIYHRRSAKEKEAEYQKKLRYLNSL